MARYMSGNNGGNHYQIALQHLHTVKHRGGNNLIVWGCIEWNGVGKLVEVQGKMSVLITPDP